MFIYNITVFAPDLDKRAFITITIDCIKYREYNGNRINVNIKPNRAKTLEDRNHLLKLLEFEFRKRLEDGTYQKLISKARQTSTDIESLLKKALQQKLSSNLNPHYASCLEKNCNNFLNFLSKKERESDINLLDAMRVQEYLDTYRTSPNNYMSKRRELGSLLNYVRNKGFLKSDIMRQTDRLKVKAVLHKTYSPKQLKAVLAYLKEKHENLFITCLLTYSTLLRPHIEIRGLKGSDFKADCTEIHLAGDRNKSGRIRTVRIPDYVRDIIYERVSKLGTDDNLFSKSTKPYNEYYFKSAWSRHFKIMLKLGIVEQGHTMYSFRHSSAVSIYRETKDLNLLKQLLNHNDMLVSLRYLRHLGETSISEMGNYIPKLTLD